MADTKVFDDPVGDSTFVDISRVRVVHRDSVMVRVQSGVPLTTGQLQCRGIRLRADIFTDEPVSIRIPRRCLENPRRVRVAVQFKDESADTVDWAVDRRTFGPWVKR